MENKGSILATLAFLMILITFVFVVLGIYQFKGDEKKVPVTHEEPIGYESYQPTLDYGTFVTLQDLSVDQVYQTLSIHTVSNHTTDGDDHSMEIYTFISYLICSTAEGDTVLLQSELSCNNMVPSTSMAQHEDYLIAVQDIIQYLDDHEMIGGQYISTMPTQLSDTIYVDPGTNDLFPESIFTPMNTENLEEFDSTPLAELPVILINVSDPMPDTITVEDGTRIERERHIPQFIGYELAAAFFVTISILILKYVSKTEKLIHKPSITMSTGDSPEERIPETSSVATTGRNAGTGPTVSVSERRKSQDACGESSCQAHTSDTITFGTYVYDSRWDGYVMQRDHWDEILKRSKQYARGTQIGFASISRLVIVCPPLEIISTYRQRLIQKRTFIQEISLHLAAYVEAVLTVIDWSKLPSYLYKAEEKTLLECIAILHMCEQELQKYEWNYTSVTRLKELLVITVDRA